jgi:hypothetical protein
MSSARATIAAGANPPRVTATIPFHGPHSRRRQARALASRCNSSQLTEKLSRGSKAEEETARARQIRYYQECAIMVITATLVEPIPPLSAV